MSHNHDNKNSPSGSHRISSSSITGHNTSISVSLDSLLLHLAAKNRITTSSELREFLLGCKQPDDDDDKKQQREMKKSVGGGNSASGAGGGGIGGGHLASLIEMHLEDREDYITEQLLQVKAELAVKEQHKKERRASSLMLQQQHQHSMILEGDDDDDDDNLVGGGVGDDQVTPASSKIPAVGDNNGTNIKDVEAATMQQRENSWSGSLVPTAGGGGGGSQLLPQRSSLKPAAVPPSSFTAVASSGSLPPPPPPSESTAPSSKKGVGKSVGIRIDGDGQQQQQQQVPSPGSPLTSFLSVGFAVDPSVQAERTTTTNTNTSTSARLNVGGGLGFGGARRKSCAKAALEKMNPGIKRGVVGGGGGGGSRQNSRGSGSGSISMPANGIVVAVGRGSRSDSTGHGGGQQRAGSTTSRENSLGAHPTSLLSDSKNHHQSHATQRISSASSAASSIISPNQNYRSDHLRVDFTGFEAFSSPSSKRNTNVARSGGYHAFDEDEDDDDDKDEEEEGVLMEDPLIPMMMLPSTEDNHEKGGHHKDDNDKGKADSFSSPLGKKVAEGGGGSLSGTDAKATTTATAAAGYRKCSDEVDDEGGGDGDGWNIPSVVSVPDSTIKSSGGSEQQSPPSRAAAAGRTVRLKSCLKENRSGTGDVGGFPLDISATSPTATATATSDTEEKKKKDDGALESFVFGSTPSPQSITKASQQHSPTDSPTTTAENGGSSKPQHHQSRAQLLASKMNNKVGENGVRGAGGGGGGGRKQSVVSFRLIKKTTSGKNLLAPNNGYNDSLGNIQAAEDSDEDDNENGGGGGGDSELGSKKKSGLGGASRAQKLQSALSKLEGGPGGGTGSGSSKDLRLSQTASFRASRSRSRMMDMNDGSTENNNSTDEVVGRYDSSEYSSSVVAASDAASPLLNGSKKNTDTGENGHNDDRADDDDDDDDRSPLQHHDTTGIKGVGLKRRSFTLPSVLSSQELSVKGGSSSSAVEQPGGGGGGGERRRSVAATEALKQLEITGGSHPRQHHHDGGEEGNSSLIALARKESSAEKNIQEEGDDDVNKDQDHDGEKGGEEEEEEGDQALLLQQQRLLENDPLRPIPLMRQHEITRQKHFFTPNQIDREAFIKQSQLMEDVFVDVSILVLLFNMVLISVHVGLGSESTIPDWLIYFEAVLDGLMCIASLTVPFFLPFERKGFLITDLSEIRRRNLSTPSMFLMDFVSTFPLLPIFLVALCYDGSSPTSHELVHYARLNLALRYFKSPYFFDVFKAQFPSDIHPTVWRLIAYSLVIVFIVTGLATFQLLLIRKTDVASAKEWLHLPLPDPLRSDPALAYTLIWAVILSALTDKKMPYPHTEEQVIFALLVCIVGLVVIIILIASVEEIIVSIVKRNNVVQDKVEDTLEMMAVLGVPEDVQEEVVTYYRRMWDVCQSFDFNHSDDVLADLPELLRNDIEYEANSRVIRSIPLFSLVAQNEDFVRSFAGELQHVVFLPGAPIVNKGEAGDCMFFLSSGDAAVLDDNDEEISALDAGAFFGEVSMLFGGEQMNTIVAVTLCVCYVITDTQFDALVETHPEALEEILKAALREMKKNEKALDTEGEEEDVLEVGTAAVTASGGGNVVGTPLFQVVSGGDGSSAGGGTGGSKHQPDGGSGDGRGEFGRFGSVSLFAPQGNEALTTTATTTLKEGAADDDETMDDQDAQRMLELRRRFRRKSVGGSGSPSPGMGPTGGGGLPLPQDQLRFAALLGGTATLGSRHRRGGAARGGVVGFMSGEKSPNANEITPMQQSTMATTTTTTSTPAASFLGAGSSTMGGRRGSVNPAAARRKSKFFLPTNFGSSPVRHRNSSGASQHQMAQSTQHFSPPFSVQSPPKSPMASVSMLPPDALVSRRQHTQHQNQGQHSPSQQQLTSPPFQQQHQQQHQFNVVTFGCSPNVSPSSSIRIGGGDGGGTASGGGRGNSGTNDLILVQSPSPTKSSPNQHRQQHNMMSTPQNSSLSTSPESSLKSIVPVESSVKATLLAHQHHHQHSPSQQQHQRLHHHQEKHEEEGGGGAPTIAISNASSPAHSPQKQEEPHQGQHLNPLLPKPSAEEEG